MRIISAVPSQTEFLYELGLETEVVGITKFCVHPTVWHKTKTRIGGTKNLNLQRIESLQPDLILANREENTREQIEYLQTKFRVYISEIYTIDDAFQMMRDIGELCGKSDRAHTIIQQIQHARIMRQKGTQKVMYLIWKKPWMTAGTNTFIDAMIQEAGWHNCETEARYPIREQDDIIRLNPDVIMLSSEPYPFKDQDILFWKTLLPCTSVIKVDGEMFSWYGSRMLQAFAYFRTLQAQLGA